MLATNRNMYTTTTHFDTKENTAQGSDGGAP
jgi:hypothetical protein